MPRVTAAADWIDGWIPRDIIQYCYGTRPSQFLPRGGRRIGMLVIGKSLRDQYDALASPAPRISLRSSRNSKNGVSRSSRRTRHLSRRLRTLARHSHQAEKVPAEAVQTP
jgi:hypothetical protein